MVAKAGTTTKTAKAAAKPAKVFDVAKPGKGSAADATARPVIISHRPLIKDPMVSEAATPAAAEEPHPQGSGSAKVVIKPLSASDKVEPAESKILVDAPGTIDLHIPDFDQPSVPKKQAGDSTPEESEQAAPEPAVDTPAVPTEEPQEDEPQAAVESSPPAAAPLPAADSLPQDPLNIEAAPATQTREAKEAAALEAEIKRQEEFEALIENKEYFLPINAVERRRSRIVTVAGLLLIVLLGLLLVNLLMDVGVIRIEGVRPLTHFFSS